MLIIIAFIAAIFCIIFFMVKISDRGDAIANQNLKPLSSAEQNLVSEPRIEQDYTTTYKSDQVSSNLLESSNKIINNSKHLIKIYNNLQQEWDALPEELDPDNEFSQMMKEINISRKIKETFEQIKKQNQECRRWIEKIELMHETSKLPTNIIERHNTVTTIRNELIDIIVDNWDEERLRRNIAADPELGYDPYDPAFKMDLSWDEIYSKYEFINIKNNRIQKLFQDAPLKFNQISQQKKLASKNNNKEELKYLTNTTLNTINSTIDATYELELLIPRCQHLHRVISITPQPASKSTNFIKEKVEMLAQLGNIISFAEERLDDLKNFNCDARSKFMELSHNEEDKLVDEEKIDMEAIRSNIKWELLIGQANVITDKIKALTKESDRLYKMVEDITTMSDDYNKNKDTLRYAIEGVIDISQRVSDLYNEGVEVEQSFYNLAQKQNIENDDLPDNVSNAIFNITQLAKTVENLSNRADEVSKLMPEKDTKGKILDIDNFGKKPLLENHQIISQSIDKDERDDLAPNDQIQQEHEEHSSDASQLKEHIKSHDEQVKNPGNSEKLSSNETSVNSDQRIDFVNKDTIELNSRNEQNAQGIISTDENEFQESTKDSIKLTNSTQQTNETEQHALQEAAISTQQTAAEIQQVAQETKSESKAAEQTMQASVSSDQITSLCNAITQLQQQIEALTTQQEQTNMQVRAQANNTLAMTMQLEQINTQLANIRHNTNR